MTNRPAFSERHGYTQNENKRIIYRDDFPVNLRDPVMELVYKFGGTDAILRDRIKILFDPYGIKGLPELSPLQSYSLLSQTTKMPAGHFQVRQFVLASKWYQFFDFIEDMAQFFISADKAIASGLGSLKNGKSTFSFFEREINKYFEYAGIGWKLENGQIVARFDEVFAATAVTAEAELALQGRKTAAERINLAILAFSARPKADLSGAVSHATSAVECVLHDITGEKGSLGDYFKKKLDLLPPVLRKSIESAWGYASEEARHGKEGVEPGRDEAELIVSICATIITFLNRKNPRKDVGVAA